MHNTIDNGAINKTQSVSSRSVRGQEKIATLVNAHRWELRMQIITQTAELVKS